MRRPHRPHRHDVWIAGAGLLAGVVAIRFGLYTVPAGPLFPPLVVLPLLAMCAAELLRRVAQPWSLLLGLAAVAADVFTGPLLPVLIMFTDVVYAAVLYGRRRLSRVLLPLSVLLTVAVTIAAAAALRSAPEALLLGAVCAGVTVTPAWTALIIRDHRNAAAAERLRAEQTALLAEMDRAQAVHAERTRMARELHDVVANHLSAIALHATAALSRDPAGPAGDALTVIRENSTQGLAEMRRLIGLLREAGDDADVAATPSLAGLPELLEHARRAGAAELLRFAVRDERPAPGPLPAPVDLAAYRIVQESLTNAVKHAAPGEVRVTLRQAGDTLTILVTSPFGERSGPRAPGSGAGLTGMRERVELLGGSFAAGRVPAEEPEHGAEPGHGAEREPGPRWRVRAELPLTESGGREGREGRERGGPGA